jgi:hypothetical protein
VRPREWGYVPRPRLHGWSNPIGASYPQWRKMTDQQRMLPMLGIVACARPGLGRFAGGDRIGMPLADTAALHAPKRRAGGCSEPDGAAMSVLGGKAEDMLVWSFSAFDPTEDMGTDQPLRPVVLLFLTRQPAVKC